MRRYFFVFIISLLPLFSFSQTDTIVKYYNKDWEICAKDTATYYSNVFQDGDKWRRIDYYASTKMPQMTGFYIDSATTKRDGEFKYFDEKGNLTFLHLMIWDGKNSWEKEYDAFYPNGKIEGKLVRDSLSNILTNEMYDERGKKIKDAVFYKEAEYPGGVQAWARYVFDNIREETPIKHGAPPGKYIVTVTFVVTKDGSITDVKALNNPGYGMQEEAIRVIKRSSLKWRPAIMKNKKVAYRQRQNIIFSVVE